MLTRGVKAERRKEVELLNVSNYVMAHLFIYTRPSLFWAIRWCRLVCGCGRFGAASVAPSTVKQFKKKD